MVIPNLIRCLGDTHSTVRGQAAVALGEFGPHAKAALPAALEGVERLYLAPHPQTVREVVRLAKEAGVRYIVDLSSSNADEEKAGDYHGRNDERGP